jgi:hypothetical protein
MNAVALIAWIATVTGGATLAAIWLRRGGWSRPHDTEEKLNRRDAQRVAPLGISIHLLIPHALLALVGLVLWIAYSASEDDYEPVEIAAPVLLAIVAVLGATMWAWARRAHRSEVRVPEDRLPNAIVVVHGLAGITTLVLVVIAIAA